jgi:hypothetical protein
MDEFLLSIMFTLMPSILCLFFESKTYFIYLLQLRLNYICIISQAAKLARFKKFIFVRLLVVHEMFLLV